jgi:UDP-GlcNAc:undecaprenyl-phosphate GlcNAc-1-phosphate transferase
MHATASVLLGLGFAIAATIAAAATPSVIALARRANVLAHPRGRDVHAVPTPLWGGLAMVVGFVVGLMAVLALTRANAVAIDVPWRSIAGVLVGAGAVATVGAADDWREMRALPKLIGQIVCAGLLLPFGVQITGLAGHDLPLWLGGVLTVIWVVAIVNAINLIDGLDGLAAGVVGVASLALAVIAAGRGQFVAATMSVVLAGSTLGFLPFNFNPARVFMGDLGAHFLGYVAAATAVLGTFKIAASVALLAPVVAFAVPILDTLWAMFRRYRSGRSIGRGDSNHIHHRLLERGLSQRQAVLIIYGITAACSVIAVLISWPR